MLFFSFDILDSVSFTDTLAAKATSAETLNHSVNRVFEAIRPKVSKLSAVHDEHVKEVELLSIRFLADCEFMIMYTFLDKMLHFVCRQIYLFSNLNGTLTANCLPKLLWKRC